MSSRSDYMQVESENNGTFHRSAARHDSKSKHPGRQSGNRETSHTNQNNSQQKVNKEYKCRQKGCNFGSASPKGLESHLMAKHNIKTSIPMSGNKTSFSCRYTGCNAIFDIHSRLQDHLSRVHGIGHGSSFLCRRSGCNAAFKTHTGRKKHNHDVHGGSSFLCRRNGCNAAFKTHTERNKHDHDVHGGQNRMHTEKDANREIKDDPMVLSYYNEPEDTYTCGIDLCGFSTDNATEMLEHLVSVHKAPISKQTTGKRKRMEETKDKEQYKKFCGDSFTNSVASLPQNPFHGIASSWQTPFTFFGEEKQATPYMPILDHTTFTFPAENSPMAVNNTFSHYNGQQGSVFRNNSRFSFSDS